MAQRKMINLTPFLLTVLLPSYEVSGLTLTVKTSYFEIGGSGVTLECNLDGAAWDINTSPRLWSVPPNLLAAITDGSESPGYTEDLSDVATSGIFRMSTPKLDWSIENQFFQCTYLFATANLNATRNILSRNSGSSFIYDDSAKKCVFTINEILPSPSKVITLVKDSEQSDVSTDVSRVTETLTENNDQGQTYSYRLEVSSEDLNDGDQVIFEVTAGPYSISETCTITGKPCDTTCVIIICVVVVIYVLGIVAVLIVLAVVRRFCKTCPCCEEYTGIGCRAKCVIIGTSLGMGIIVAVVVLIVLGKEQKLPCQKGSQHKKPDSGNSGSRSVTPNQVSPSIITTTPRTERGNATNQGNETKDPLPKTDDKPRHQELQPLTNATNVSVEDGKIDLNTKHKLPDIPSKKSS